MVSTVSRRRLCATDSTQRQAMATITVDVLNMLYARYYLDTKNNEKAAEYAEKRAMAADDIHWVWPIPSYEVKVNPNLENEQNPGY